MLEIDPRGKVRLSMRVVDQETGAELEDTRPAREPREGGDRPRGDRDRRRPRAIAAPAVTVTAAARVAAVATVARAASAAKAAIAAPARARNEGGNGGNDDGPAPEFAPAFLTRDDD